MCRVLGVSPAGYHAWRRRPPSARAGADAALLERIRSIHAASHGTYGAARAHAELCAEGHRVGRKRVARLMRAAELAGVSRRKGIRTTRREPEARPAADLVERNFTATALDQLWVADITYVPTWAGFLYLAVVLDAFSRRVSAGPWPIISAPSSSSTRPRWRSGGGGPRASSTTATRGASIPRSPSASAAARPASVPRWGRSATPTTTPWARAPSRPWNGFRSQVEARMAVFSFIEGWYNPRRRHSALGYLSPLECERNHSTTQPTPSP